METPDKWIVLKIGNIYKVFATWYGGYLGSDSWKINSGIKKVEESPDSNYINFIGYSGSIYACHKHCYGTSMYTQGIINNIIKGAKENKVDVEIMDSETNWINLEI